MKKILSMTEMGFRTAHTEVTTYKLHINIVKTEKVCFRTEQNRLHKTRKDKPRHRIKKREVIR
jgi:Asp-tRNA(Asn)/Glu-tRNA(Gln) amidotransferase C subunit